MTKDQSEPNEKSRILQGENTKTRQGSQSPESNTSMSDLKELIDSNDTGLQSSLPYASFNYINSIIGSGVIGMPYAFQQSGFGLGMLLLVFVAILTDYSLVLMVRGGHLSGVFSYQGVMEAAFGRTGYILLSVLQFMYPFIAMVSYNIVVGDTITKVCIRLFKLSSTSYLAQRELIVGIATVFITLPLCLYKDIAKLAKVSLLSLVCVGFILLTIFLEFFMLYDVVPRSEDAWSFANWNIIPSIGIMAFAFMCHHNTFLIYGSIKEVDQRRWDKVTHISLFTSFLIAAMFGITGYATFTGYSQGDLLENYCWNDDLMNAARIYYSVTILLTYPIECFVTREVLEKTVFLNLDSTEGGNQNRHFLVTLSIVLMTYLISMSTDCLGVVLELNGVLAAVPLAYILPALCYIKLEPSPILSKAKAPAFLLVIFGLVVAVLGVVFMVMDYKTIGNCSHGAVMAYCSPNSTVIH